MYHSCAHTGFSWNMWRWSKRTGPLPSQSTTKELELAKTQPVSDSNDFVVTGRK